MGKLNVYDNDENIYLDKYLRQQLKKKRCAYNEAIHIVLQVPFLTARNVVHVLRSSMKDCINDLNLCLHVLVI